MLAARVVPRAALDDPGGCRHTAGRLAEAWDKHVAVLAARDPAAHATLDAPYAVATPLRSPRKADAEGQARNLVNRLPTSQFISFRQQAESER